MHPKLMHLDSWDPSAKDRRQFTSVFLVESNCSYTRRGSSGLISNQSFIIIPSSILMYIPHRQESLTTKSMSMPIAIAVGLSKSPIFAAKAFLPELRQRSKRLNAAYCPCVNLPGTNLLSEDAPRAKRARQSRLPAATNKIREAVFIISPEMPCHGKGHAQC